MDSLSKREIGHLVYVDGEGDELSGELAMPDRQELDDAVLELLGIDNPAERAELRSELYAEITRTFRAIRTAEKRMQGFRSHIARRGRPSACSIATEIWDGLETKPQHRTALDFAPDVQLEEIDLPEGKARVVGADLWNSARVQVGRHSMELGHLDRARFLKSASDDGLHGLTPVPTSPEDCRTALLKHADYTKQLDEQFASLASAHTSDEQMQERVVRELWRMARYAEPG
jgi:hypothetical protein